MIGRGFNPAQTQHKEQSKGGCQFIQKIKSSAEKHFADNNLMGTACPQSCTCNTQVLAHL